MKDGVEGWGLTQVEHIVPRSQNEDLKGVYGNILYICRLCNGARHDTPQVDQLGRRLLDPTIHVWSEHFRLNGEYIEAIPGDTDAVYTADVYDMNERRKVALRARRLNEIGGLLQQWDFHSRLPENPVGTKAWLLTHIRRYTWIPSDAPTFCRCGNLAARTLPAVFNTQVMPLSFEE